MLYRFLDFEFDSQTLLLKRQSDLLSLNEKPAKLLALLLAYRNELVSKEKILDSVWAERVVTDQVVFQNISYLRALFGDSSIKTFSKKGYQWQLPLQTEELINTKTESKANKWLVAGFGCCLFVITLLFLVKTNVDPNRLKSDQRVWVSHLDGNTKADILALAPQAVFDSPSYYWQQMATTKNDLLIAHRWYPSATDAGLLRFHIQGEHRMWQDYIVAESEEVAQSQLSLLLQHVDNNDYFQHQKTNSALAELTTWELDGELNSLIAKQQITHLSELGQLQRALAISEQQLDGAQSDLEQGLWLLTRSDLAMKLDQWSRVLPLTSDAIKLFSDQKIPHLQARALYESSWGYFVADELREGMKVLNQAVSLARQQQAPLLEVKIHVTQSFLARKAGLIEFMHTQINMAKELITLHQLPAEHLALIYDQQAWATADLDEKLSIYQTILSMPYSELYRNRFYTAAETVRSINIQRQQWQQAESSIYQWQRPSFQAVSHAKIAFGQKNWQLAKQHAQQAYQLSRINEQIQDSLDAALLLLQSQSELNESLSQDYVKFIEARAKRRWLRQNHNTLESMAALKHLVS